VQICLALLPFAATLSFRGTHICFCLSPAFVCSLLHAKVVMTEAFGLWKFGTCVPFLTGNGPTETIYSMIRLCFDIVT
jgi:hypothetical protein